MTPETRRALLKLATETSIEVPASGGAELLALCSQLERIGIFRRVAGEHGTFERVPGGALLDLMVKHRTDKALHRFDYAYGLFFGEERRQRVSRVLELGIKAGASVRVWEEYFPNAQIFGVDLNPKYADPAVVGSRYSDRTRTFVGSQADERVLAEVCAAAGPFDLIVDDGSHQSDDQVASLRFLWPFVKDDGVYAIEDTHAHASYPEAYSNDGRRYPPMSEMLAAEVGRRLAEDQSRSPGICVFEGIALLVKRGNGPVPDFDPYLKR